MVSCKWFGVASHHMAVGRIEFDMISIKTRSSKHFSNTSSSCHYRHLNHISPSQNIRRTRIKRATSSEMTVAHQTSVPGGGKAGQVTFNVFSPLLPFFSLSLQCMWCGQSTLHCTAHNTFQISLFQIHIFSGSF